MICHSTYHFQYIPTTLTFKIFETESHSVGYPRSSGRIVKFLDSIAKTDNTGLKISIFSLWCLIFVLQCQKHTAMAKKQCNERFKAVVFLKGLKGAKAEDFHAELANRSLLGEKKTAYPENVKEAKDKFAQYKSRKPKIKTNKKQNDGGTSNQDQRYVTCGATSEMGVSFAQTSQQLCGGRGGSGGQGGGGGTGGGG